MAQSKIQKKFLDKLESLEKDKAKLLKKLKQELCLFLI